MSKQINDTLVIGTIIVPKQECFCLGRKANEGVIYMSRKRLTQVFPFLLPLRKWQKKKTILFENAIRRTQVRKKEIRPTVTQCGI